MNPWHDVEPERIRPENFLAIIEIPKGSKKKYELDKTTGLIRLDRILFTSTHYPQNYGFIPRTLAGDNDPLDVLVLCSETLDPLAMVECYPIGVIKMVDDNEVDEKIIAIPFKDPVYSGYRDISTLPRHILEEISHFFEVYKSLEHSETSVKMSVNRDVAIQIIEESLRVYNETFSPQKSNTSSRGAQARKTSKASKTSNGGKARKT
ncbi:MAG: inorganic diphosphatase [Spirochaetaceae bacterium]|nr:MAG: inorganic diphosphatase [Spirochaetaceae bacterium]